MTAQVLKDPCLRVRDATMSSVWLKLTRLVFRPSKNIEQGRTRG